MVGKNDILEFLRENKPNFSKKYNIEKIGIFGSFSTGNETIYSDIDLVYHLKAGTSMSYKNFILLTSLLESHFKLKVDLVNYKYMNPIVRINGEKNLEYV